MATVLGAIDRTLAARRLRHRDKSKDAAAVADATQPPGTDCLPQIRHIVLLMMENHSFDNYFGTLGHGEGLTQEADGGWGPSNERLDGGVVRPYRFPSTIQHGGVPTQTWNASHIQFADGNNDGFVSSIEQTVPGGDPKVAMGYWTAEDLPFYADLARTFPLADRWFSSLLGPTFPNRRFLMAATANGLIDDVFAGMLDYPRSGTIFDLLDRHRISWSNYHHAVGWTGLARRVFGNVGIRSGRGLRLLSANFFPQFLKIGLDNLQFTADIYPLGVLRCAGHLKPVSRFFQDARDGTLPAVSIVDPDFQACSEENPQDVRIGEGFAAEVIKAVMGGKGWPDTLLIWFYDEHGGSFDHVPPPPAVEPDGVMPRSLLQVGGPLRWVLQQLGDWTKLKAADTGAGRYDRYGFRVPAVVVSPYAKPNYVSHTIYDHTSALKLIERKWNLPPLTARDAAANDPLDMLDFDHPSFMDPPTLSPPAVPWSPSGT
ncbi:MAG TPA: alkaline phosphatase family protein [Acidimicrobiales bacterium]|jgi:phospholipase C